MTAVFACCAYELQLIWMIVRLRLMEVCIAHTTVSMFDVMLTVEEMTYVDQSAIDQLDRQCMFLYLLTSVLMTLT